MTAGEVWAAVAVLTAAQTTVFWMCVRSIRDAHRSSIREEKETLRREAAREIERRARERTREILASIRIQMGVQLINESDIAWGSDIKQTKREEDAA